MITGRPSDASTSYCADPTYLSQSVACYRLFPPTCPVQVECTCCPDHHVWPMLVASSDVSPMSMIALKLFACMSINRLMGFNPYCCVCALSLSVKWKVGTLQFTNMVLAVVHLGSLSRILKASFCATCNFSLLALLNYTGTKDEMCTTTIRPQCTSVTLGDSAEGGTCPPQ